MSPLAATLLVCSLLLFALLALAVTLAAHAAAYRLLARKPGRGSEPPPWHPPVSVLRPLRGVDPGLYDNLASLARQDYEAFELMLGAEDPDDPALAVAERLRRDFPEAAITIVAGAPRRAWKTVSQPQGARPRRADPARPPRAPADLRLQRPRPARLPAAMVEEMTSTHRRGDDRPVGLVSSVLAGGGEESLGALFENLHLNSFVAASVCAAQLAGHPCVVGKSMLLRRRVLDRARRLGGGRRRPGRGLRARAAFHRAGLRVALSPLPLPVIDERRGVGEFLERHLRWCQMRRRISPAAYVGEPLLNPVPWFALAGAAALAAGGPGALDETAAAIAAAGIAVKAAADALLARRLGTGAAAALAELPWTPVKDLLIAGVWVVGFFRRTICWRGHRLRLGPGSRLEPVPERAPRLTPAAAGPEAAA